MFQSKDTGGGRKVGMTFWRERERELFWHCFPKGGACLVSWQVPYYILMHLHFLFLSFVEHWMCGTTEIQKLSHSKDIYVTHPESLFKSGNISCCCLFMCFTIPPFTYILHWRYFRWRYLDFKQVCVDIWLGLVQWGGHEQAVWYWNPVNAFYARLHCCNWACNV